jgi:uncharacterized DUF497 family protein
VELEWDEEKRKRTLEERGLDFADIARFDPDSLITQMDDRRDYGEPRFNSTGYLDGTLCSFCWTPRNGRMRIISMRKINARERKVYEIQVSRSSDT